MQRTCKYLFFLSFFCVVFLTACPNSGREESLSEDNTVQTYEPGDVHDQVAPVRPYGKIVQPDEGDVFKIGDDIEILLSFDPDTLGVETIIFKVDRKESEFSGSIPGRIVWNSSGHPAGRRELNLEVVFDNGRKESYSLTIQLLSDIVPRQYTYRLINSYPHDIKAFTQGLVYYEGFLYESTGQYGRSTLRKVELETGRILKSLNLEQNLFGEGLCVHDDMLYQLTWKSRVGFVYDIETFTVLNRIHYQTEGWGLASDGSNLLKSDGSHYIYLLDPQYFSETGKIEVFDHKGRIDNLNELEFIDGVIYANVFGTNNIVKIEQKSGRVIGVIDISGILASRYHHPNLDVLNGIAYDHDNDRLFVTGKNWPLLFEIELVDK